MTTEKDVEGGRTKQIPHFTQVWSQATTTEELEQRHYNGSGTEKDPYIVTWIEDDPRNPTLYSPLRKSGITALVTLAALGVSFGVSAYSGGGVKALLELNCSQEIYSLGITLYCVGLAFGPLLWAPMSEMFGRQLIFAITYGALTAFNAGAAGSKNIQTLLVIRSFAGFFASATLTNAAGVLADMFSAKQRSIALSVFVAAEYLAPGPVIGGFVGETIGWRWVEGVMAILTGTMWIACVLLVPETYPPVLQRKRAAELSRKNGAVYRSRGDVERSRTPNGNAWTTHLSRPLELLFREPIVLFLSIYMAIAYATLYLVFCAFPIVYQQHRGWSPGIAAFAFLGVAIGIGFAVVYAIWDNKSYATAFDENDDHPPPELRLPMCIVGGIAVPIGLFWFAWTCQPSVHYTVSITAGIPFGFGMILIILGVNNYLVDEYTVFAASVLAASALLRITLGAGIPLFTTQMYNSLGANWASSVPAFIALATLPFPILLYKYGKRFRTKSKYAAQADAFMRHLHPEIQICPSRDGDKKSTDDSDESTDDEAEKRAERTERAEHE